MTAAPLVFGSHEEHRQAKEQALKLERIAL